MGICSANRGYVNNKGLYNIFYGGDDTEFKNIFKIDYTNHKPIIAQFELYSIIEIDNSVEEYTQIKNYVKYLITQSKFGAILVNKLVFGDETRDSNRDKFLNNLGLIVIGYDENNYICILLYPILFEKVKKYQQSRDLINSRQYRNTHSSIFGGLTEEDIEQLKIENPNITDEEIEQLRANDEEIEQLRANDEKLMQKKLIQKNITENLQKKHSNIIAYNEDKKELDKIFQDFKEIIIQNKNNNITNVIKLFKIPYNMAKLWRPMAIKSFTGEYIQYYHSDESYPLYLYDTPIGEVVPPSYKDMKKFMIVAHGLNEPPEGLPPTIDLEPNEIVIMSCNPWEPITAGVTSSLIMEFSSPINVDSIHYTNIAEFLGASLNDQRRQATSRNNYCFYMKRCPNLSLQFYNPRDFYSRNRAEVSVYQSNIPFFTFESPMRYNANTIRELLQKLNSDIEKADTIRGISGEIISEEIQDLPLNQDNEIPNMLKYLFDNINLTKSIEPMMDNPLLLKYMSRIQDLVKKMDAQEHIPYDAPERAVSTYYTHIDFQKQNTGSLLQEIESIREYNKSPHLDWSNNPHKYVIYFVKACRS